MGQNRLLFQGLFMAPHITAQALKTAIFCAKVMEKLGYEVSPKAEEPRYDIIQTIAFGKPEPLRRFCEGIQSGAPVDSFVTPEPWAMPGYDDPVIMAAGAFVQGASIEPFCRRADARAVCLLYAGRSDLLLRQGRHPACGRKDQGRTAKLMSQF